MILSIFTIASTSIYLSPSDLQSFGVLTINIPFFGRDQSRCLGQSLHILIAEHLSIGEALHEFLQLVLLSINHESPVSDGVAQTCFETRRAILVEDDDGILGVGDGGGLDFLGFEWGVFLAGVVEDVLRSYQWILGTSGRLEASRIRFGSGTSGMGKSRI